MPSPTSSPLRCPVCDSGMDMIESAGVTVDRCESCGGTWFDDRELAEALRSASSQPAVGAVESASSGSLSILCPRCRAVTSEFNFAYDSGVLINECPACRGVFLQKGEFEQIAAFKAKWATAALESARYANLPPPVEQPERLLELIQSRKLFVSAIVVLLCLAMAITGRVAVTLATMGVSMIFPLICFWFADSYARYFGLVFGPFRFPHKEPTPALTIAIIAWFSLFALFVATIVS